jgi:hypothetical protein
VFWEKEKIKGRSKRLYPNFKLYCKQGKVQLPIRKNPPQPLNTLLTKVMDEESKTFLENIRAYNSIFSKT